MQLEKEKARFAFEILKRFAPYMDHCNEQQERKEALLEQLEMVTESFRSLDEAQKAVFRPFMHLFSTYIDEQERLHTELHAAYGFLSEQTVTLVTGTGNAQG